MAGIHTRLGSQTVHEDLDLAVMPGEILGIVGGSERGKSTLCVRCWDWNGPREGRSSSSADIRRWIPSCVCPGAGARESCFSAGPCFQP